MLLEGSTRGKMLVLAMQFSRDRHGRSAARNVASAGTPRGRSLKTEEKTGYQCINWESLDSGPGGPVTRVVLLRKEVIQPHLPVRLPCYDFTPVANPTFGSSLPNGLGH